MTFWDNPQMVLNHIQHSCVTSDDTGVSEMVIVQDEPDVFRVRQRKKIGGMFHIDEGNDFPDFPQSFDIAVSPGVMGRTPKPNLKDKYRKRPEHQLTKTIHWNDQLEGMSDSLKEEMFVEKILPIEPLDQKKSTKTSQLSQLLEDALFQPSNPYLEYAKFDGEGLEETCSTKTIHFFLPFIPSDDDRGFLITATIIDTATVTDVKGLILYKACLEGEEGRIDNDVNQYAVWIADDDGTVDTEFPVLDEKEVISKYGFQYLAVDEKDKQNKANQKNVRVKIHVQNNGYSTVRVDRTDVKMKTILAKFMKKRVMKKTSYQLQKEGDSSGQFVDLESTLESTGTLTFNLTKAPVNTRNSTKIEDQAINDEMLCIKYKSYQVVMVRNLLASTEVSLGIHGQKIEIDPVAHHKSQKFWPKIKPVSLDVNNIAECEITEEKPAGKANFRIYYKKYDEFKHFEFESTRHVANEIVSKIYNILKSRSQPVRDEFLHTKDKKAEKTRRK